MRNDNQILRDNDTRMVGEKFTDGGTKPKGAVDCATVRDFYDRVYHANSAPTLSSSRHLRRIASRVGPLQGKRVLDVGCGVGDWLKTVAALGAIPAGVDISSVAVDACRRSLPKAELHCGPAEELPFRDGQFDLISCMGALEHFLNPEAALHEMVRVAKPEALFLLLVPNAHFPPRRLGFYSGTEQSVIKEEALTLEAWKQLFESAGLRVRMHWKDLHVLSISWIFRGPCHVWPLRLAQALVLPLWPISWQYQVYYLCKLQ
jgi:ubiquinone/menaquinone biosynthesis C-methylase UbiE